MSDDDLDTPDVAGAFMRAKDTISWILWILGKAVGLLMFVAVWSFGLWFPGIFLALYTSDIFGIEDIFFVEPWGFAVFMISLVVSGGFWYVIYKTKVGFRILEPILTATMNLLEHGHYRGGGPHFR